MRPLAWAASVPVAIARTAGSTTAPDRPMLSETAMDACASCGGPLSADLQWCPRCLAPVERRDAVVSPLGHRLPPSDPAPVPVYSRWKAGPTSFGAAGRITLTVLVLLGVVVGYPTEGAGPFLVVADRLEQMLPVEVRPQHGREVQLRVGGLPEQEVRDPLLAGGPDDEVGVRHVRVVETAA